MQNQTKFLIESRPRWSLLSKLRTLRTMSRAARCVARHGVGSHAVPVALVGECSMPVA